MNKMTVKEMLESARAQAIEAKAIEHPRNQFTALRNGTPAEMPDHYQPLKNLLSLYSDRCPARNEYSKDIEAHKVAYDPNLILDNFVLWPTNDYDLREANIRLEGTYNLSLIRGGNIMNGPGVEIYEKEDVGLPGFLLFSQDNELYFSEV